MTLKQLFDTWLNDYAKTNCVTWKDFERHFELYLSPLASKELADIKRMDVVALQSKLFQSRGKSAANKAIELLKMLYNKALDWELYEGKNPAQRIKRFRLLSRERFLQPEELPKFFAAVSSLKSPRTRDYILMLLWTGQRRGNVAQMRWEEIDFVRGVWRIPLTKNGTPHSIPLVPEALAILEKRKGSHPTWVFPLEDGTGTVYSIGKAWESVTKRAGLTNCRPHDLRRTLASWEAATGASLPIIGRTLNHADPSSTQIYARLHLDPVREAMVKAVDAMRSS
jgi:integrase